MAHRSTSMTSCCSARASRGCSRTWTTRLCLGRGSGQMMTMSSWRLPSTRSMNTQMAFACLWPSPPSRRYPPFHNALSIISMVGDHAAVGLMRGISSNPCLSQKMRRCSIMCTRSQTMSSFFQPRSSWTSTRDRHRTSQRLSFLLTWLQHSSRRGSRSSPSLTSSPSRLTKVTHSSV